MTSHTAHGITTYARSFSHHPFGDEQEAEGPYEIQRSANRVRVVRADMRNALEYTEFMCALHTAAADIAEAQRQKA